MFYVVFRRNRKLRVGFQLSLTAAKLDFSFGEDCLLYSSRRPNPIGH